MTTGSTGTKRRTLLQRGFALLAGGAAIAGGTRWAAAASPPVGASHTLYARRRPVTGAAVGHIVSSTQSPFGAQPATPSSLEFHVLELKDGTLFSISNGANSSGTRALAIIGGTNRFAGKSGNYVERAIPGEYPGDDLRELTVTFAG